METQLTLIEEIQQPNQLVKLVETSGLEKNKADYILQKFQDYFKIAAEWESKAKVLVVSSASQTAEMKMAREGRLFLKQKRVEVEKARKELKEQIVREGKAIDGIANTLKALIEPIEEYLERQEKFIEIQEDNEKEVVKAERVQELQRLGVDVTLYDLKNMPEDNYNALIAGIKLSIQQKIEAEKRAEEERIAQEKERERIRLENEQLKKEAQEREKQLKEEKAKAEAERRLAEKKALKMKAEQEAKLKKEREEREKVEAQLKAKAEAEAKERKRIEQEKRKAERAPDKAKLLSVVERINTFELPEVKNEEAKKVLADVRALLNKVSVFIKTHAEAI